MNSNNREVIANHIYHRLYDRFLKIFDYRVNDLDEYEKDGVHVIRNRFTEEYKNGFLQMASCALLIETFAAFLKGEDETPYGRSKDMFRVVFEYAYSKQNPLQIFRSNDEFYSSIRCGLLHQGETKGTYKISRTGDLFTDRTINAYLFHKNLKELIKSYSTDLKTNSWDSDLWVKCRKKLEYIESKHL